MAGDLRKRPGAKAAPALAAQASCHYPCCITWWGHIVANGKIGIDRTGHTLPCFRPKRSPTLRPMLGPLISPPCPPLHQPPSFLYMCPSCPLEPFIIIHSLFGIRKTYAPGSWKPEPVCGTNCFEKCISPSSHIFSPPCRFPSYPITPTC